MEAVTCSIHGSTIQSLHTFCDPSSGNIIKSWKPSSNLSKCHSCTGISASKHKKIHANTIHCGDLHRNSIYRDVNTKASIAAEAFIGEDGSQVSGKSNNQNPTKIGVVIIGAGLAGLAAARQCAREKVSSYSSKHQMEWEEE